MEYVSFDAVVVGSGAAGFSAACRLKEHGVNNVAVITEGVNCGTSRNTGSDKQTYYKLGMGNTPDSVRAMAADLFACGAADGDTALCEAALSAGCFLYLAQLGVPFPHSAYGEYVGYKTDHDMAARASSAGPLTSKYMTEALQKHAGALGVSLLDGLYVTEILTDGAGVCGVAAVDNNGAFTAVKAANVILATGGPAGVYADTVYPLGHTGSTALALRAGAALQNITEWQYGLASVSPRWNVSGSFMQALPRFISVDEKGDTREFLADAFETVAEALHAVFLKGYQWPFDAKKAQTGSSRIDLLVYEETVEKGRRVYLDFTKNPFGLAGIDFASLPEETRAYLQNAHACLDTPIARLDALNRPAIELFRSKGVDLEREPLEIALCAQHCNGGVSVNTDWETEIPGLFAAGECAGTHGIVRPGGSALNAGQAGALRAAQKIARTPRLADTESFSAAAQKARSEYEARMGSLISTESNVKALTLQSQKAFSGTCGAIRNADAFGIIKEKNETLLRAFAHTVKIASAQEAADLYRLKDTLTVQIAMLESMRAFAARYRCSRGGAVYTENGNLLPYAETGKEEILTVRLQEGAFKTAFRPVRPIPPEEESFETMWKKYREPR